MFNRTTINPPAVNIKVDVPPANAVDAARLFGELKAKAEAEVRASTIQRLGANNVVSVVRLQRSRDFETDKERVRMLLSINGHSYEFEAKENNGIAQEVVRAIIDTLAAQVSAHLLAVFGNGPSPAASVAYSKHTTTSLSTGFDDDEG